MPRIKPPWRLGVVLLVLLACGDVPETEGPSPMQETPFCCDVYGDCVYYSDSGDLIPYRLALDKEHPKKR